MTEKVTIPFIYKWIEISTGKWYIGAHYKIGCHPNDGYICSSKTVKPLIEENPENWKRMILEICDSIQDTKLREADILLKLNARMDPMSYNKTNADGKFGFEGRHTDETIQKMKDNHKDFSGTNNPMYGRVGGMKGKKHSADTKKKISQSSSGKIINDDVREKISKGLHGLVWINNGNMSKKINPKLELIPDGWELGMLPSHIEKLSEAKSGEKHWNYNKSIPENVKQKISKSLSGHKETEDTKLKKRQSSLNRKKILCERCNKEFLQCHRRYHIKCS